MIVTQKEKVSWFKTIDYYSFTEWLNFRIQNDLKYNVEESFYCIIIIFPKSLIYYKNHKLGVDDVLIYLKPKYPWSPEYLDYFKNSIDQITLLKEKLKKYENK